MVVELPAPLGAAHRLFDGREDEAAFFESHDGITLVGLGVARIALARGPGRFDEVRRALAPELSSLSVRTGSSALAGRPVALGGFAFEETLDEAPEWSSFGAARLVVPKWLYRIAGELATLSRVVEISENAEPVWSEYQALSSRLSGPTGTPTFSAPRQEGRTGEPTEAKIRTARALIRDRVLGKVVIAERRSYRLEPAVRAHDILARLGPPENGAVRFGFRRGDVAFVGSTPERLVLKQGGRLETEAVAGSVVLSGDAFERSLLESRKDLDEQGFVLRFIQDALESVSDQVVASAKPMIRRLTHVGHLVTKFRAEVDPKLHILDVARRLHPTPAVAGTPTAQALEHIAAQEGFARGWYAGAIGWFDAKGDGEFRVALRAGLIQGRVVQIFAGAGIVAESEPARELEEIESKHRRMMDAIGAES
jgi:menaquinone-specific isochorismate synthase